MIWKTNSRDWKATFYKRNRHENREHEFLEARIKQPTREGRRETRDRRGSIIVSCFSIHFDYAWYIFFDENIPLFSSLHDDTKIPPRGNVPSKVSIFLNPCIHHRFHFPWPFVCIQSGYASERHFLPQLPRRWNRGTVFPFPPFFFRLSFSPPFSSRFTFHPFFHGTTIDYRNPLFPYFSADTLVSFFVDGFSPEYPLHPPPPRALDSIRWNSYTSRMVSFISIGWMWFLRISRSWTSFICVAFIHRVELCW